MDKKLITSAHRFPKLHGYPVGAVRVHPRSAVGAIGAGVVDVARQLEDVGSVSRYHFSKGVFGHEFLQTFLVRPGKGRVD